MFTTLMAKYMRVHNYTAAQLPLNQMSMFAW